jgi:tetratricopeptide (TPR) repeat protein
MWRKSTSLRRVCRFFRQYDSLVISSEGRTAGLTDYAKFETVARSIDEEVSSLTRLSNCFQEMRVKWREDQDEASKWCKLDHVHGPGCKPPVPGCSHDHSDERKLFEKSFDEKLKSIRMFREEGNSNFRSRMYARALSCYRQAIVYLDYSIGEDEEQDDLLDSERFKIYLNQSAVYLELTEWRDAINSSRLAIQLDPTNGKAFFRRGMAQMNLDDFDSARKDLGKSLELSNDEGSRSSVRNAMMELDRREKKYRHNLKTLSRNIFQ